MSAFISIYQAIPAELWPVILGPIAAGFVEVLKRVLGVQKAAVVVHALTATIATLLTVLPTILMHAAKPPEFLAAYAASIYAAANFAYVLVKAMAPFWASVKAYEARKSARSAENAPATVAATSGHVPPAGAAAAGYPAPAGVATAAEFDG